MKKLSFAMAVCILFCMLPSAIHISAKEENTALLPYIRAEVGESISALSVGTPFVESRADSACAQSFTVAENGNVFVVDSYLKSSPVKEYGKDGSLIQSISAAKFTDDEDGISAVTSIGDNLYLLTYDSTMFEYNVNTGEHSCIEIPEGILSPSGRGIFAVGRYVVFISYDKNELPKMYDTVSGHFLLSGCILSVKYGEGCCFVCYEGTTYVIPCEEHTIITPLGRDKSNNLIVEYNNDGISYRKYTQDGKLAGYAEETYEDQYVYISDIVRVHNGELFRARCDGRVYALDIVNFGEYKEPQRNIMYIAESNTEEMLFEEPQLSRSRVLERSEEMLNLKWSVKSDSNVESRPELEITVAGKYMGKKLRYASVGTEYTGIPYCLGGMCGTEKAGDEERQNPFKGLIALGYTAGNVLYQGKYKSGSAGVDCSGFVSLCYSLPRKRQAKWFCNSYGHTLNSYTELRAGDFLVEYDDERHHVMLVYETPESGTAPILVAESTMHSDNNGVKTNGTIKSARPYSYYKRFTPKTAWHTWKPDGDVVSASCKGCNKVLGLRGDANEDNCINTGDAAWELRYCAGMKELSRRGGILGDVNGDGEITTLDVKNIMIYAVTGKWKD